ncbi:unnamed protein product [Phytomonas sp. EM1]|nr:unnamed protein product [Phytomonas sp. EM1]|eukprot:CCW59666.1 unnamed protein product [Phytomonas sp. isolate EM1]
MLQMPHDGDSNLCGFSNCCFSASGELFLTATPCGLRAISLIGSSATSADLANLPVPKSNARMAYPVEPPSLPTRLSMPTGRLTNETSGTLPIDGESSATEGSFTVRHGSTFLSSSTFLWSSPVRVVAVAGDSPVVAVLFEHTAATSREGSNRPQHGSPPLYTEPNIRRPGGLSTFSGFQGCPHVHLFDASSGLCLAELYFRGVLVYSLLANSHFLLVGMRDCFHVINIRTLAHVRKQSVPNLIGNELLTLSQTPLMEVYMHPPHDAELKGKKGIVDSHRKLQAAREAWRIAYPSQSQSASSEGTGGSVRVLTISLPSSYGLLHSAPAPAIPISNPALASSLAQQNRSQFPQHEPPPPPSLATPGVRADTVYQSQLVISPHRHTLAALQLSMDGALLASASVLGSTVKLMDAICGVVLHVFQRGHLRATVLALAFNPNASSLAALSSGGTLHIFHYGTAVIYDDTGKPGGTKAKNSATMSNSKTSALGGILNNKKKRAFIKKVVCPLLPNASAAFLRPCSSRSHSHFSVDHVLPVRRRAKAADTPCLGEHHGSDVLGSSSAACGIPKNIFPVGNFVYSMCFSSDGKHVWVAQQKAFTRFESMMKRGAASARQAPVNTDALVKSADTFIAIDPSFGLNDSHLVYASIQRFSVYDAGLFASEIYNVRI